MKRSCVFPRTECIEDQVWHRAGFAIVEAFRIIVILKTQDFSPKKLYTVSTRGVFNGGKCKLRFTQSFIKKCYQMLNN